MTIFFLCQCRCTWVEMGSTSTLDSSLGLTGPEVKREPNSVNVSKRRKKDRKKEKKEIKVESIVNYM